MSSSELFREIEFKEYDKPYHCKLCDQTLRYCYSHNAVFEVSADNPTEITRYSHQCRKLQGRKPVNMFEQQLDPLELYQKQQYDLAIQQRKEVEAEEEKRIDAGRHYLANRHKKEKEEAKENSAIIIEFKAAKERIVKLEEENAKLRQALTSSATTTAK